MYCDAFLGEGIEELKQIRPDPDHLTIEMRAADRSDLIVMFLGSPGTFAELTAFAMTPTVNPKLLVFNEARFKDVRSFLSEGPLRLIDSRRKLYYDPASSTHLVEVARHLDQAVSALLFEQWNQLGLVPANLDFSSLVTLGAVFVTQPSPYRQLNESSPLRESDLRGALKVLLEKTLVVKDGERYRVRDGALRAASERHLLRSWSRVRLELMGRRIDQTSVVDDLRSLF